MKSPLFGAGFLRLWGQLDLFKYNDGMNRLSKSVLMTLVLSLTGFSFAQKSGWSPLGVLITPPKAVHVSKELTAILPKYSAIRLVQSLLLTEDGEDVVVYERGNQYEPDSHLAIVKSNKIVADFSLAAFLGDGGNTFKLFRCAEFETPDHRMAFVTAFRGFGDGSGTIFLVITERNGRYTAWKRKTTEGSLSVLRNGEIQVWSAGDAPDGGIDCVWCSRYYDVQKFDWVNGALAKSGQFTTKHIYSPYTVADRAIVVEK